MGHVEFYERFASVIGGLMAEACIDEVLGRKNPSPAELLNRHWHPIFPGDLVPNAGAMLIDCYLVFRGMVRKMEPARENNRAGQ